MRWAQVLMTREYRARLAAGAGGPRRAPTFATVRVRLPEGVLLQGEFNAGEPVSSHTTPGRILCAFSSCLCLVDSITT